MHRDSITTDCRQTIAPDTNGVLCLPTLEVSPYFGIGSRALNINQMAKAQVLGYQQGNPEGVHMAVWDNSNNYLADIAEQFTPSLSDVTSDQLKAAIITGTKAQLQSDSGLTFADSDYSFPFANINNRAWSYPSLAVNTSRQASTAQDASVSATVDITTTLSLTGGTTGKVELKYADDSAFTTNVKTVQGYTNSNTGSLTIGLNISQIGTASLKGMIPAAKYYRLVTTNVTGTPTYGTPVIQEVLL